MKISKIFGWDILFHILFWGIYVLSEYLANMMHLRPSNNWIFIRSTLLSLPLLMIPTYLIAFFAVPKFLIKNKIHWFLLSILIAAIFVFWGRIKWLELINYLQNGPHFNIPPTKVIKNVIRDYSIIALAICIYIIGDWRKNQQLNEQLIKAKAEAEIKLLKGQLQPHFLFNSLNNIYSLALMKSDLTADSILKLTELLDYLVYRANLEKVELTKEVQLLKNYVDLEKLRYGEKLKIEMELEEKTDSIKIAPLLLLPFAENCFKHGGVGTNGVFKITIHLQIKPNQLFFQIKNSKKNKRRIDNISGGVGLKNIKHRLQLLYPNKHELKIEDGKDFYNVQLTLNLI
ncbi:MAG: sensor histidine kinase [Saprospiraceae bacterium]